MKNKLVIDIMEEFFKGKIFINCQSLEEVERFLEICKEIKGDIKFCNNISITLENCGFEYYEEELCYKYSISPTKSKVSNLLTGGLAYASVLWIEKESPYPIIKFKSMIE